MNAAVVDTDVVSFVFRNHSIGSLYEPELKDRVLLISFMTLAELDRWAIQSSWGDQRRQWLRLYLERFVILPYSRHLCTAWAQVTVDARAKGRRIECADAWIAATALHHNVPLITHNRTDYLGVSELKIISHADLD